MGLPRESNRVAEQSKTVTQGRNGAESDAAWPGTRTAPVRARGQTAILGAVAPMQTCPKCGKPVRDLAVAGGVVRVQHEAGQTCVLKPAEAHRMVDMRAARAELMRAS